jgi:hypothetical protein
LCAGQWRRGAETVSLERLDSSCVDVVDSARDDLRSILHSHIKTMHRRKTRVIPFWNCPARCHLSFSSRALGWAGGLATGMASRHAGVYDIVSTTVLKCRCDTGTFMSTEHRCHCPSVYQLAHIVVAVAVAVAAMANIKGFDDGSHGQLTIHVYATLPPSTPITDICGLSPPRRCGVVNAAAEPVASSAWCS